ENPNMTRQRAFQLSKQMTDGYKLNLFILHEFSFIGWELLGILCCCIGTIFVVPYKLATWAEAYTCLKAAAKANGYTNDAELPGFAPVVPQTPVAQAVAQAPVVEAPVAQAPIVEAPVAQTVVETPIVEAPIAQTVIEAPVIEQPTIADIPEMPEMPEINQDNGTIGE
ncbi:MAG: DUF975 family protein, partial [Clostridia bacterium]|nr:DUF975 family protein [Clostridia bacterium]